LFLVSCGQNNNTSSKNTSAAPIDSSKYVPKPIGWTNDYIHLFSATEIAALDSLINDFEKKTTVEISIATVDSAMMGPIDFTAYSSLLMRSWGVGKKETNNGILIVIAPSIRRIRIQNGYGTEKVLSNEKTASIISQHFLPKFKDNKFFEGTREGLLAIINEVGK
jgi:uncharacterized protein